MVLVRRLVLAETGVAIDPVNRLVGIRHVIRRETLHRCVDRGHQLSHGLLHGRFENRLARLEPLAAVVALQTAKELESLRGKTGKYGLHELSSLIIEVMPTTEETQLRLAEIPNLTVSARTPLSRYTRFGIGGPADLFAETRDEQAFIAAIAAARESGTPVWSPAAAPT